MDYDNWIVQQEQDLRGWNDNYGRLYDYNKEKFVGQEEEFDEDDIDQYNVHNKQKGWDITISQCCGSSYTDSDEEFGRCSDCKEISTILYIKD